MIKDEKFDLAVLLLISLLLSIYLFFRTYVISFDGAFQYIPIAKDFASGHFRRALSHNQQSLYPLIVAFVSQYVPDFESAGKLVSSLFGILVIFPVYFLGKRIFDEKVAFLSSLLLAIHLYLRRYSADVLKESTYLFFLATALWFAWRAIQDQKKWSFLFIPFLSVIAYLVRPDGVEILLVVFFYVLFIQKFGGPGRKKVVILFMLLSVGICMSPYLFYLREIKGEWIFSKSKPLWKMLALGGSTDPVPFANKIFFSFKQLNRDIFITFHYVYIFLLIIGLLKKAFLPRKAGEGFLLSFFILHYLVSFLLVLNTTEWSGDGRIVAVHLSGRHVMPLFLVSIFWIGEGLIMMQHWVSKMVDSLAILAHLKSERRASVILVTLLVIALALILPFTLKPQRYERLPEKWAGMWIKNQSGKGVTIFTTLPRVAFYAEGNFEFSDLEKGGLKDIKTSMVKKGAVYLVLEGTWVLGHPEVAKHLTGDFIEAKRFEHRGMEKLVIYRRAGSSP
jgi:Dolichyl-phosphate-mannose-protein mannosyltransferase